jgi:hypothetical protein
LWGQPHDFLDGLAFVLRLRHFIRPSRPCCVVLRWLVCGVKRQGREFESNIPGVVRAKYFPIFESTGFLLASLSVE